VLARQALALYWTASSTFGLVQNISFRQPAVRRMLKIVKTPSEQERPVTFMLQSFRRRYHDFWAEVREKNNL